MKPIPVEFHIGPLLVHTYGIGLALTFYICYRYFEKRLRDHSYPTAWLTTLFLWVIPAIVVGARVFHVLANLSYYSSNPTQIFEIWNGGLSSYGGLTFAFIAGLMVKRFKAPEIPLDVLLDLLSPVLVFGWAIGRLLGPQLMVSGGGRPTNLFIGMYYADQFGKRLPAPIFQSVECFIIFFFLLKLEKRLQNGPGYMLSLVALVLWDIARFLDQALWINYPNRFWDPVEIGSLVLIVAGLMGIFLIYRRWTAQGKPVPARFNKGLLPHLWYESAIIYQIYPLSFAQGPSTDSYKKATGVSRFVSDFDDYSYGNLQGIINRLDHLESLGVHAIWLSPITLSPMADYGYDVADYKKVDPVFGTNDDFKKLIAQAHSRGIRVILDFVPNHTSSQHEFFLEACKDPNSKYREFYYFRKADNGDLPNNWLQAFGSEPAWTKNDKLGDYYLHSYFPEQPDLNWDNKEVQSFIKDALDYWLDLGVDGFRFDAIQALGKAPDLADLPNDSSRKPSECGLYYEKTLDILSLIKKTVKNHGFNKLLLGEVFLLDFPSISKYLDSEKGVDVAFSFPFSLCLPNTTTVKKELREAQALLNQSSRNNTIAWVLSNHDMGRLSNRYKDDLLLKTMMLIQYFLPGPTIIYQGDEFGLAEPVIDPDRRRDRAGRDGSRALIPWPESELGWPTSDRYWLPFSTYPDYVEDYEVYREQMLTYTKQLIEMKKAIDSDTPTGFDVLDYPDYPDLLILTRQGLHKYFLIANLSENSSAIPDEIRQTAETLASVSRSNDPILLEPSGSLIYVKRNTVRQKNDEPLSKHLSQ